MARDDSYSAINSTIGGGSSILWPFMSFNAKRTATTKSDLSSETMNHCVTSRNK